MKKAGVFFLCVVTLVVGLTGMASALTLSSVEGTWTDFTGDPLTFPTVIDDVAVAYGNGLEDQIHWGLVDQIIGGPAQDPQEQSGLGFTGAAPLAVSFDVGDIFEIGQFRHLNTPVYADTAATSAELNISLVFSDPALTRAFDLSFAIEETPNPGDDVITFPTAFPTQTFDIGGVEHTLELLGFGDTPASLIDQLLTPEGTDSATKLFGRITTSEGIIPEPGTILLLGSGLLGLIALKRKLRK